MDGFISLPGALIARCWPAKRVIMGKRVCKQLRDQLLQHIEDVVVVKLRDEAVEVGALLDTLRSMQSKAVSVVWRVCTGAGCDVLVEGLEGVMASHSTMSLRSIVVAGNGRLGLASRKDTHESVSADLEEPSLTDLETDDSPEWGLDTLVELAGRLAAVLDSCTSLTELRLPSCATFSGASRIMEALAQCRGMKVLDLSGNNISGDSLKGVGLQLQQWTALTSLDLSQNFIGDEGITQLMSTIEQHTSITALKLGGNSIFNKETVQAIGKACAQMPQLACLHLSDSPLGLSVAALVPYPETVFANLHSLLLARAAMHYLGCLRLKRLLPHCPALLNLDLRNNQITDKGAVDLSNALMSCAKLSHLSLVDCQLQQQGATALGPGLAACSSLCHLDVTYNSIQDAGVLSLTGALARCANLKSIFLRGMTMTSDSVHGVAHLLRGCSLLTRLDISRNRIGAEGALRLAEGLAASQCLARLELKGARIGDEGATHLAAGLVRCPTLSHVDVAVNDLGDSGAESLLGWMLASSHLSHCDLTGNPNMGQEMEQRIASSLGEGTGRAVCVKLGPGNVNPSFY